MTPKAGRGRGDATPLRLPAFVAPVELLRRLTCGFYRPGAVWWAWFDGNEVRVGIRLSPWQTIEFDGDFYAFRQLLQLNGLDLEPERVLLVSPGRGAFVMGLEEFLRARRELLGVRKR